MITSAESTPKHPIRGKRRPSIPKVRPEYEGVMLRSSPVQKNVARLSMSSINPKLIRSEFLILPGSGNMMSRAKETLKSAAAQQKEQECSEGHRGKRVNT